MATTFLLITNRGEAGWSAMVSETLTPLGSLRIISEEKACTDVLRTRYDLIIIDAAAVKEPAELVSRLCRQRKNVRIVVVTASPTWREARDVLCAGAFDYFRRPPSKEELLSTIKDALDLPLFAASD